MESMEAEKYQIDMGNLMAFDPHHHFPSVPSNRNKMEYSDSDDEIICMAALAAANHYRMARKNKLVRQPKTNCNFTGQNYMNYVLSGNNAICHEQFRMEKHVFEKLCNTLHEDVGLERTRNVSLEVSLGMFLKILGQNEGMRSVGNRFQRSKETVSRHFHKILKAVLELCKTLIVPRSLDVTPHQIRTNRRFWPFFKDCVGAIDGTYIGAQVPIADQLRYLGRKGITQNVMAVCSFDMFFTYVVAGWEGQANDANVFLKTINNPNSGFPHPPSGKYYLVDSGYPLMDGYMTPYRGVYYHLQDFRRGAWQKEKKELFNHLHSSLRTVIERCFRVLMARWAILRDMHTYSIDTQRDIVIACMGLHNFIRNEALADVEFAIYEELDYIDEAVPRSVDEPGPSRRSQRERHREMKRRREVIAEAIKEAYDRRDIII